MFKHKGIKVSKGLLWNKITNDALRCGELVVILIDNITASYHHLVIIELYSLEIMQLISNDDQKDWRQVWKTKKLFYQKLFEPKKIAISTFNTLVNDLKA